MFNVSREFCGCFITEVGTVRVRRFMKTVKLKLKYQLSGTDEIHLILMLVKTHLYAYKYFNDIQTGLFDSVCLSVFLTRYVRINIILCSLRQYNNITLYTYLCAVPFMWLVLPER